MSQRSVKMRWPTICTYIICTFLSPFTSVLSAHSSELGNGKQLFHVLLFSGFSYSHCLESFGAAQMLVDHGEFEATLFAQKPCRPLADRAKQVSRYPDRLSIIDTTVPDDMFAGIHRMFEEFAEKGVMFGDETFRSDMPGFREVVRIDDYPLRGDNFSFIQQLHADRPFHVALCDVMAPACLDFADKNNITAVHIAYQGDLFREEIEHNGLWLAGCPSNSHCSLRKRFLALVQHFTPFHLLPLSVKPASFINFFTIMRDIAIDLRRDEVEKGRIRPKRPIYPRVDQRIVGTLMPAAYYRSDHAIVGPTWFGLLQTELNVTQDSMNAAWLMRGRAVSSNALHAWLERATKPVVYVSFGTLARLNRHETLTVLEGIVSDQWLTIWKTNTLDYVDELRANNTDIGEQLSARVRKLIANNETFLAVDWTPQFALIRHPAVKVFVTHGGMSSLMEACDTGIQLLCVPLFCDQLTHCGQIDVMGNGLQLSKYDITPEVLRDSIENLLNNDSFAQKAQQVAKFHRNVDTAGRLVDFVRYQAEFGYEFYHIASDDWRLFNLFTYWNLDLVLVLVGVLFVLFLSGVHLWQNKLTV